MLVWEVNFRALAGVFELVYAHRPVHAQHHFYVKHDILNTLVLAAVSIDSDNICGPWQNIIDKELYFSCLCHFLFVGARSRTLTR